MKLAVFFERDGLLNRVKVERFQQISPESLGEFHLNPEALEPLQQLKDAGFLVLVTTNQPGLSRGTLPRRELDQMHQMLRRHLPVDDIFVCPHDEADRCPCRKPKPGLFLEASFKWKLDLDHSFVVSNKWQDAQAADVVGCTSMLLRSPFNGNCHRDFIVPSLVEAVRKILQLHAHNLVLSSQY
jgi:D-glycero-D-manno-heptose 1,7-bisphosphate phosphatase